ncbi:oligopeptide/dipeptide ABC transporter, ATPase subunit [Alkaliphilus oremlandii OhILAs]|uniref:Oligopeptide/dipeptide ABC transporter, ATPase subunit n=1 Tax=Alkaliphilus oremlandii (strain OhILAs) TaxID=350688 RepID=A8MIR2_ALKOO|nr:oligopeptide/dipeptide ABC transporter ATP-binding protein [Alkaliphilus oremlandii]ABW19694.1 oligopeptide/dipeptide ABC transporter, ATPase subunit [Alkaliphilus oremlandii OhILAs]
MKIIEVIELKKQFPLNTPILEIEMARVCAVNGISFHIDEGETLGLVGESGSGKTTTGKLILKLIEPSSGKILFEGRDISNIHDREFRRMRRDIQVIFQNPYASLDPKMTIGDILTQPLSIHKIISPLEYKKECVRLLNMVGLSAKDAKKFSHEFSGGQRQRIGIARAIATKPKFIVCDEPVSALDVSIQSQILNLMMELKREFKLSYLFIAHGLNVIKHVSDRVAVMYLGKIVEIGPVDHVFSSPKHPYTKALMSASPIPDPDVKRERIRLKDEIPSPLNIPSGCSFHTRCQYCMDVCKYKEPQLSTENGHSVACHLFEVTLEHSQI